VGVPDQSADPHILKIDHVVPAQQRERGRVMEVAPLTLHRMLFALEQSDSLAATMAEVYWHTGVHLIPSCARLVI
jgi:hypothetical protein